MVQRPRLPTQTGARATQPRHWAPQSWGSADAGVRLPRTLMPRMRRPPAAGSIRQSQCALCARVPEAIAAAKPRRSHGVCVVVRGSQSSVLGQLPRQLCLEVVKTVKIGFIFVGDYCKRTGPVVVLVKAQQAIACHSTRGGCGLAPVVLCFQGAARLHRTLESSTRPQTLGDSRHRQWSPRRKLEMGVMAASSKLSSIFPRRLRFSTRAENEI